VGLQKCKHKIQKTIAVITLSTISSIHNLRMFHVVVTLLPADSLLGLFFNPVEGRKLFLQNVS
jgi:hypothetical protein